MKKTFRIPVEQLITGLVLAEDLRHPRTGLVLIPAGTSMKKEHLSHLKLFDSLEECLVYDPSEQEISPTVMEMKVEAGMAEIKPLPETVNENARKVYLNTFETVKQLFQRGKNIDEAEVQKAGQIAADISEEVLRDPYVLPQIAVLKAIDNYTFSHSIHVAIFATTLAKFLDYSPQQLKEISLAGLLHDIGKLDIPREIVEKPGPLTDEEFKIMKQHAWYGYQRLKKVKNISGDIVAAVSQHHEKQDGTGYYQQLKGEKIHPWASILATADIFDALTTDRVYRKAILPHEGAEIIMGSSSIKHLDHQYATVFARKIPIYPLGTRVMLSTGEKGRVVALHSGAPLRPVVEVEGGSENKTIDLSANNTILITSFVK